MATSFSYVSVYIYIYNDMCAYIVSVRQAYVN